MVFGLNQGCLKEQQSPLVRQAQEVGSTPHLHFSPPFHYSVVCLSTCLPVHLSVCIITVVRLITAIMMMVPTENSLKTFFSVSVRNKIVSHPPPLSPSHLYLSSLPPSLSLSSLYLLHASFSLPLISLCFLPDSLPLSSPAVCSFIRVGSATECGCRKKNSLLHCSFWQEWHTKSFLPHHQMDVLKEGNPLFPSVFPKSRIPS